MILEQEGDFSSVRESPRDYLIFKLMNSLLLADSRVSEESVNFISQSSSHFSYGNFEKSTGFQSLKYFGNSKSK